MNNRKHRSDVLNSSGEEHTDEEQACMPAAAHAITAVPREPAGCYSESLVSEIMVKRVSLV